jgi:hypothetical protein
MYHPRSSLISRHRPLQFMGNSIFTRMVGISSPRPNLKEPLSTQSVATPASGTCPVTCLATSKRGLQYFEYGASYLSGLIISPTVYQSSARLETSSFTQMTEWLCTVLLQQVSYFHITKVQQATKHRVGSLEFVIFVPLIGEVLWLVQTFQSER